MSGASGAAYLADGRPVARATFYALACDPRRSVVVEACAGAGKTWMLVSRILRALLDGAEPHEILAITFTRKAAGEMRDRLNEWLRAFSAPHADAAVRVQALRDRGLGDAEAEALAPALATLHERVLRAGRPVEVRTFHAWFSQLLRAAPLELLDELGLQPDMALIEDVDEHRADVFRRFHGAVLRDAALASDHRTLIAQRGRSQVRRWLESAWDKRVEFELADAAGVLDGSVAAPADHWPELAGLAHPAEALASAVWRERLRALALTLGRGGARAQEAATGLVTALEAPDPQTMFDAAWSALFTGGGTPRKLGADAELADVQDRIDRLASQIDQHHAHLEHGRMVRLTRVLLAEYAAYKRSRGLADMADLERCGLALLRDATLAGWVQERLDARIRHVLIDEFQDTSPLQWHALLAWLSAYAGAGGGASGQRPPGVFIVGDPKQSIYRFRRAEPRVFAAARDFVFGQLGGAMLACDHTRRNAPEVLEALNSVFGAAASASEFDGFRPHTTEVGPRAGAGVQALPRVPRPPRVAAAPAAPGWRDTLTTPRHQAEELLREQEAAQVATAVGQWVRQHGVRPGEIFVLSRKRQSLRLAAQALRRLNLPYAAVEDFELMAAPEARDLVALLDVLVSPQHRLSLAQALRSPLFGASDDDLVALAGRAAGGDWWRALLDAPHGRAALDRARHWLPRWQAETPRLPPHDLLDRIVAQGELRERVAATVPPEQRIAALDAVDALLAQALTLDGARYATPYNFVRALRRRALQVPAPVQADAVQLLTVHGAKGLEARVVFVMDTDPQPRNADSAALLVDWPVDAAAPVRCAFVYSEARCPPSLQALLAAEVAARQREELNGLYVAMTRAKDALVVSATAPSRNAGPPSWWQRLEPVAAPWTALDERSAVAAVAGRATPVATLKVLPAPAARPGGTGTALGAGRAAEAVAAAAGGLVPTGPGAAAGGAAAARRAARATADDTGSSLLGKAVHRLLEWTTGPGADADADAGVDALAAAAAAEFGVAPAEVARLARTILSSPQCAAFFGGPALRWAANEVPVGIGGELGRIDRLVQLDGAAGAVWWVLDYKLGREPERSPVYRAQLIGYRDAVRRLQPGAAVRCAFITGAGALVEIDTA